MPHHKYNIRSILIRKDDEVQSIMSSELHHKYNIRSIMICKDDEVLIEHVSRAASQEQCLFQVRNQAPLSVRRSKSGEDNVNILKEKLSSDKPSKVQKSEQKYSGIRPERV